MSHVKLTLREKRKQRIRKKITGSAERPRFTVFRSNRYIYAQVIDDSCQKTIVSASSLAEGSAETARANKASAEIVGKLLAERALQKGIKSVVFDRNGYHYHGVIKQIAESARTAGLEF